MRRRTAELGAEPEEERGFPRKNTMIMGELCAQMIRRAGWGSLIPEPRPIKEVSARCPGPTTIYCASHRGNSGVARATFLELTWGHPGSWGAQEAAPDHPWTPRV